MNAIINFDFASLYPRTFFNEEFDREVKRKQRNENINAIIENREPEPVTITTSQRMRGHLVHDIKDITISDKKMEATIIVEPEAISQLLNTPLYISSRKKEI